VHYLAYNGVDTRMGMVPADALWDLVYVGLLTKEEAEALRKVSSTLIPVILSWLSRLWHEMLREGSVAGESTETFTRKLTDLRSTSIQHIEQEPNLVKVMLKIVVALLVLFIVISHPMEVRTSGQCWQPWAMSSTFLTGFCYVGILNMIRILEKSPYFAAGECINIDGLLCHAEQVTFRCLRTAFGRTEGSLDGDALVLNVAEFDKDSAAWDDYPGPPPDVLTDMTEKETTLRACV